ncbi:unnamed protein product [Ixodes persulcatus]
MWYAHTEARKYKHIPKHVLRAYLYAIVIFITAEQFRPVITAFYKFSQLCVWFFRRNRSRARFPKSDESRYHISCRLSFCSLNRARSNKIAEQSSGLSTARPLKETVVCAFSGCSSTLLLSSLLRYVLVCAYQRVPDLCSSSLFLDLPLRTGKCSSLRILQALCINQLLAQVLPTAWKAGPTNALIAEGWLVPRGVAERQWETTVCCGYLVVHQRASLCRRVGLKGPLYGHACLNGTPARVR